MRFVKLTLFLILLSIVLFGRFVIVTLVAFLLLLDDLIMVMVVVMIVFSHRDGYEAKIEQSYQ